MAAGMPANLPVRKLGIVDVEIHHPGFKLGCLRRGDRKCLLGNRARRRVRHASEGEQYRSIGA
jgi:hypothetical protein